MTNEKAIEMLKVARCAFHGNNADEMAEAFAMAIDALKEQPVENIAGFNMQALDKKWAQVMDAAGALKKEVQ